MKDKLDFYINGLWTKQSTAETIQDFNPATEEVIGFISAKATLIARFECEN